MDENNNMNMGGGMNMNQGGGMNTGGEKKSGSLLWSVIAIVIVVVLGYLLVKGNSADDTMNTQESGTTSIEDINTQSDSTDLGQIDAELESMDLEALDVEIE